MVEAITKIVNHRTIVFDTEKFDMLKNAIEKIMNDKKFKPSEVVFIGFAEMEEIGKISTVLKMLREIYRVHSKGYVKGVAVNRKTEKIVKPVKE